MLVGESGWKWVKVDKVVDRGYQLINMDENGWKWIKVDENGLWV